MGRGGDVALVVSLGAIFQCRAALFDERVQFHAISSKAKGLHLELATRIG
jgi:hypothetical protein